MCPYPKSSTFLLNVSVHFFFKDMVFNIGKAPVPICEGKVESRGFV
jgi:hypothetical protein